MLAKWNKRLYNSIVHPAVLNEVQQFCPNWLGIHRTCWIEDLDRINGIFFFRFQSKGMDVGLTDESLNGVTLEDESEDELNGDDENGEDIELIRAKRAQRERPLSFANMSDIKSKFETGHSMSKEERREERKQEIQNIRSRLFMGKQAKIKEMYQQAVLESEQGSKFVARIWFRMKS